MSDTTPPPSGQQGSYAEPGSSEPKPSGKRTAVIAGVTAGTLAVVGVGAFAAVHFLSGGPQAEQAIPANAIAVVSMDLDPGAKQKVEALKTLRKFPELKKQLKLGSGDDLRKKFFDEALKDEKCKSLSYDSDIKPWIGDNVALAAVPYAKTKLSPVIALSVTDKDKAAKGLKALFDCTDSTDDTALTFSGDFAVISDSQAHADQAVKDAEAKPLTDDAAYQEWSGKVGDRGVANFYIAKSAAGYIADSLGSFGLRGTDAFPSDLPTSATQFPTDLPSGVPSDLLSDLPSDFPSSLLSSSVVPSASAEGDAGASAPYAHPAQDDQGDAIRKALAKFKGAAGALRFADGGAELEVVGGGVDQGLVSNTDAGDLITGLPGDTTAVFGIAVPKGFASKLTDNLKNLGLPLFGSSTDFESELENQLGITVPDDLESLLGQGVALSLRGTPADDLSSIQGPEDLPVGLTVKGDPDKIKAVIAKIEAKQGKTLADSGVSVEGGDGKVTLSFDGDYAKSLQGNGDLGDNDSFKKVVPNADKASMVIYVDFNSKWREAIAKAMESDDAGGSKDFLDNTEALEAFGVSSWVDGDTSHALIKLTTD